MRRALSIWIGCSLGVLLAWSAMAAATPALEAQVRLAREQMTLLALGLTAFQRDLGHFPTREEGLGALVAPPADAPAGRWQGPYLEQPPGLVPDPWGQAYVYDLCPADPERPFTVYSCGPDGVSASRGQDPDDIRLWPDAVPMAAAPPDGPLVDAPALRVLRRPLGLVLALTVVVALLRWYVGRSTARASIHPGGYVRRHLRRGRRRAETPAPPEGS